MAETGDSAVEEKEGQAAFRCLLEEQYEQQMREVETRMAAIRQEGKFFVSGGALYYELYPRKEASATIVICHGFCESSEKYWEFIHYFYSAGFQVAVWDQRGHGKSFREGTDANVVHVEDFEEYVKDLHVFMEKVVKPFSAGGRLYLYAHSMGGCVGARYLEQYPADFEKAVLNAPMLALSLIHI